MGEAVHAPPNFKGRGASGPARGGAAIFGTAPGARLNTIKVRDFHIISNYYLQHTNITNLPKLQANKNHDDGKYSKSDQS